MAGYEHLAFCLVLLSELLFIALIHTPKLHLTYQILNDHIVHFSIIVSSTHRGVSIEYINASV